MDERRTRRGTRTPRDVVLVATGCLSAILLSCVPIWMSTARLQAISVRSAYASQGARKQGVSRRDTRVTVPYDQLLNASISRSTEQTVVQSMCRCNSGSLATPQQTRSSALQDTGIIQEASLALGNAKRHFVLRETSCACRAGIGTGTHVSI